MSIRYMTKTGFAALCFLCQGIMTTAIAWSSGFVSLAGLAALYGVSEAGLIVIFPLIVAEFVDEDKQTVAIPSASFLAGPLCLLVAPLIGKHGHWTTPNLASVFGDLSVRTC